MKTQTVQTRNYRKFYALLGQMPGGVEGLKETIVGQYTDNRTTSVQEMKNIEFAMMLAAMEQTVADSAPQKIKLDKARKRVIAVIGAWLRSRGMTEGIARIKGIACRAAKVDDFNKIPLNKLRALYEEWRNKKAVSVETDTIILNIEDNLALMN
jgi:hypothetical protein